ncbi:F0F1 ATP synthase subunit delta [Candidatus Erwinia haradaeae]|nr:F0F1 ATP synthase subunit delta [Candidatus Erwinia haradaeae]
MINSMTLARPYAQAAFDYAVMKNRLDQWQNTLTFTTLVVSCPSIKDLISGPLAPTDLSELFIKICGDQLDKPGQNFIRILSENKRLLIIPTVLEQFIQLRTKYESIIEVEVLSSSKLSNIQISNIRVLMEKYLSSKIKLNYTIDKSLIAGLIIRIGDIVIDGSIRNRIEQLTKILQS